MWLVAAGDDNEEGGRLWLAAKVVEVRWGDGEGADGGNMMGRIRGWWCCGEVTGVIVVTVGDGESGGVAGVVVRCVAMAMCRWWWEGCRCEDDGGDVVMVADAALDDGAVLAKNYGYFCLNWSSRSQDAALDDGAVLAKNYGTSA
nr:hypothetical protein [Tanacetum cinerariifolium]